MITHFKVLKHDCASCTIVMEGICEDTSGVTKAEVNSRKRTLTVEHDETVSPEQLAQSLTSEGYPVEITPAV